MEGRAGIQRKRKDPQGRRAIRILRGAAQRQRYARYSPRYFPYAERPGLPLQDHAGLPGSRKAGWDTHGLPVELGVEKELGITKEDIGVKITVEDYNKKCREVVMRYKDKWEEITEKMGYWVDMEHPYVTFDNEYIETLWWALKSFIRKSCCTKA
jgi:hypothetical protein